MKSWFFGVISALLALLGALALALRVRPQSERIAKKRQRVITKQVTRLIKAQDAKARVKEKLKEDIRKKGSLEEAKKLLEEAKSELQ